MSGNKNNIVSNGVSAESKQYETISGIELLQKKLYKKLDEMEPNNEDYWWTILNYLQPVIEKQFCTCWIENTDVRATTLMKCPVHKPHQNKENSAK